MTKKKTTYNTDYVKYFKNIDWKDPKNIILYGFLGIIGLYLLVILLKVLVYVVFIGLIIYGLYWVINRSKR